MKPQYLLPLKMTLGMTLVLSGQAYSAGLPDAGQTVQQLQQKPLALPKTDRFAITAPALAKEIPTGGEQVEIKRILFGGTSKFTVAHLIENALGGSAVIGQSHDLASIKGFANKISEYYRAHGYPFARAFIPPQTIENGVLHIKVVEGQYGKVTTTGTDEKLNQQAQAFLSNLKSGEVIESKVLERATLILSDQTGVTASPAVQPGAEQGTGDLVVEIKRDKLLTGSVGVDNQGNRYTGENKAKANLNLNSPFMLGDQITIAGTYSEEKMWYGSLGYSLPIHGDGLRANVSYAHTYYQLGKDFKDLGAKGTADIVTAGVTYPIIRSQQANLNFSASVQHKTLNDDPSKTVSANTKQSDSLPVALNFDTRDTLLGGAITFGALTWTRGNLSLNDTLAASDTNKTAGDFNKLTLDLARMQALPANFSLYVRGTGQWSDKNLDSSEGFGIGGITGVRAYPTGEGYGNVGWVTQTELRYTLNEYFSPYAFYDVGSSTANQITIGTNTTRHLSGAGIGLRYTQDNWSADVSGAWRITGGKPSDQNVSDTSPRLWFNINYQL